jgi:hypothetical protein
MRDKMTAEQIAEHTAKRKILHDHARNGTIIESGWQSLVDQTLKGAGERQLQLMRMAFFCGAKHLQAVLLGGVALDMEEDQADLDMMDSIDGELDRFITEYIASITPGAGRA